VGLLLWAPLEEGGLLLVGEEAGRRRLAPVEVVAAEEAAGGIAGAVEAAVKEEAEVKICLRRGSWLGFCCERLEEQRREERRTDLGPWGVLLGCCCRGSKQL
jgi:hypothetical protein